MKRVVHSARLGGILLVMLALVSCAGHNDSATARNDVRVRVASVGFDQDTGSHFVLLKEENGKHSLPLMIGDDEARAIMFELHGIKTERPLTHDLLRNVIRITGNHVDRVVIGNLRHQIYYAKIYLDDGRYKIDSRPSDAIALAMGTKAPIYVAKQLFDASGSSNVSEVSTAAGFGITVQQLTPDLAQYFSVRPDIGVVVADLDPSAARSGLERGDIVTQIDSQPVKTLDEFSRTTQRLKQKSAVTLTIRRKGDVHVITLSAPHTAPTSH